MKIICKWTGDYLWGRTDRNGLAYTDDDRWLVIELASGLGSPPFNKRHFLDVDINWQTAFEKIENGLKPNWRECSCGAQVVMGSNWSAHSGTCESLVLSSPFEPKNNDGRDSCFKCAEQTRPAGGGQYTVCRNKDCGWFDK